MLRLCLAFPLVLGTVLGIDDKSYSECVGHLLLLPATDRSWPNYNGISSSADNYWECVRENFNKTLREVDTMCQDRFNYRPKPSPSLLKLLESRRRRSKSIRISHQEQTASSLGDLRSAHNSESIHSSINDDLLEYLRLMTKHMTWEEAATLCTKRDHFNLAAINQEFSSSRDDISEALRRLSNGLRIYHQQNVSSLDYPRSSHNSESIHSSNRDADILGAKDSGPAYIERQITRQQQTASSRDNRRSAHVARKSESIHDAVNLPLKDYLRLKRAMDGH